MSIPDMLEVTKEIASILLPFVPYFVKGVKLGGQEMVKKIGEIGGQKAWDTISNIWQKLKPKIDNSGELRAKVEAVANNVYDDPKSVVKLESILNKILLEDITLKEEFIKIIEKNKKDSLSISNYMEVSKVLGELVGIEVSKINKLEKNLFSHIKLDTVEKGGKVTGIKIDSLED